MRLFVALDIDPEIRKRITTFRDQMHTLAPEARWVGPETFHITLQFLGETDKLDAVRAALERVKASAVPLTFRGAGFFPNQKSPRVFWAGIESDENLQQLADAIGGALKPLGFEREHGPYKPHLTLARAGSGRPRPVRGEHAAPGLLAVRVKLETLPQPDFGTMTAREFCLYESKLSSKGAQYTKLSRYPLEELALQTLLSSILIIVVVSYLLGSIPFGYLLVWMFRGQDVRNSGSGNIGATNVARTGSKGLAIATLLLDAAKGYAAVALAFHLSGAPGAFLKPAPHVTLADMSSVPLALHLAYLAAALAAFCAMVGHMFPVWLRFRGGKGVATAVGAFGAIAPRALVVALALFVVIVAITRYVSLGSMVAAAVFPFACWWLNPLTRDLGVMSLVAASSWLIVVRHKDNIGRLMAGTENRFR